MKKFNLKKIAKTISMVMSLGLASVLPTTQVQASDIEIYKLPEAGQKTIVLMLDTSGSMRQCDISVTLKDMWRSQTIQQDFPISNLYSRDYWVSGWEVSGVTDASDSRVVSNRNKIKLFLGSEKSKDGMYDRYFCYGQRADGNPDLTSINPDRITRLKDAVFELMNSDKLNEDVVMGVGVFTDAKTGSIIVPAKPLTPEHKLLIKQKVAGLDGSGGTPTANAYAELAAYMLGTTTNKSMPNETAYYEKELYVQLYRTEANGTVGYAFAPCKVWNTANPAQCDSYDGHNGDTERLTNNLDIFKAPQYRLYTAVNRNLAYKMCNKSAWSSNWCLYDKTEPLIPFTFNATSFVQENSGFAKSVATSKNGSNYLSPLPTTGKECGGQALYFLTDGYPNTAPSPEYLMKAALGSKGSEMPTNKAEFTKAGNLIYASDEGMAQAGILAKILRDPKRNPAGVEIKTAVVGFGSDFETAEKNTVNLTVTNSDGEPTTRKFYDCSKLTISQVKNACNWGEKTHKDLPGVGGFGEGGFFYAKNSTDIIQSVLDVVNDIPTKTPDVKTGSPTIPVDALSRQSYVNSAYYAEFSPTPEKLYQLWKGTMGKYNIANGILVGSTGEALFNSSGENNKAATALWSAVDKLTLQQKNSTNLTGKVGRKVLTNRTITNNAGANSGNLTEVTVDSLFSGAFKNDPHKNYWLNFLGYLVAKDATGLTKANLPENELRQMGATMHSTPILLTQKGKVVETNYQVSVTDREDYLLYGSTQGALHVLDEKTGEEKFAFVPHEMLENQREALLEATLTTGGRNNLFYGVDAPWTAHTVYAIDSNGYSTVVPVQNTDDDEDQQAHQWVYGGLRMGGRSYYALDLTNINSPTMKFHIDPTTEKVYSNSGSKDFPQIRNMGQSWSKPVLGYVNWKNSNGVTEKKLVMFVGGGYDAGGTQGNGDFTNGVRTGYSGYEQSNYNQTNKRGAGVYMFDANNGDLLWWTSSNQNAWNNGVKYLSAPDMKYSVVSRINAVDRNSDGLIDNLYFGDLGGQAFRVDLNNNATSNDNFGVRAVKLFSENNTNGTSPRFYNMPSVAIFIQNLAEGGDNKRFATVSFVSGDMSSPLAGTNKSAVTGQNVVTATAQDGVFVAYDNDLGRSDLYTQNPFVPRTTSTTLSQNDLSVGVKQMSADGAYNRGWKYIYPANTSVAGTKKGLNEPYTFVKFLFANMYNKDSRIKTSTTDVDCGGGVIGNSTLEMFCMPTGKCTVADHGFVGNGTPSSTNLGAGIVGASLGNKNATGSTTGQGIVSIAMNNPVDCKTKGSSDPRCQGGPQTYQMNQLRWYESK